MTTIIFIVAVALIVVFCIFVYNSLVQLSNKVKEAFSTMDVYLKQRFDLIPNLVDTVKAYLSRRMPNMRLTHSRN